MQQLNFGNPLKEITKTGKKWQKTMKHATKGYTREPIPADKKNAVRKRAGNKCEYLHCTIKGSKVITLQFHHKDLRNNNNALSNIQLLCATHHGVKHKESDKRRKYLRDFMGRGVGSTLVKKGKKKRKTSNSPFWIVY